MDGEKLTDYAYMVAQRYDEINTRYILMIAEQIKEIGEISPSNLFRMQQMIRFNENVDTINEMLMMCNKMTLQELFDVYEKSGMDEYGNTLDMYKAHGVTQVPFADNFMVQQQLLGIKQLTAGTFANLSLTTNISEQYRNAVDLAIQANLEGMTDVNSSIRQELQKVQDDIALNGIKVTYASGYTRRLDSAIRMNIIDGVKQVNNSVRVETAKQYGSDGVEISAHALCAVDHQWIQGQQFTNERFEIINSELKRKISTCNCKHFIKPIIVGINTPTYTRKELQSFRDNSNEKINVNGMEMTKYEASQYMRNIETEVRKQKDASMYYNKVGDDTRMQRAEKRIKQSKALYNEVCKQSGLKPKTDRMYVAGYNKRPSN